MSEITMTKYDAVRWMARLAAADGVVTASERRVIKEFAEAYDIDPHVIYRMAHAIASQVEIPEVEALTYTEMIGRIFEEFVVSLCADKSRFTLLSWRSDKIYGQTFPLENLMPDLRIRHHVDCGEVDYMIECKYRSYLPDGIIDLTAQLARYKKMLADDSNCEIFIGLGVDGSPSCPESFYILPCRILPTDKPICLDDYAHCLCLPLPAEFHNYINQYFTDQIFNNIE